jgi:DNA modification methylase
MKNTGPQRARLETLKPNPKNPRVIKDDKFQKLVQSIRAFPQMLEVRPIVCTPDGVVLGGNMRLRACKEAGLREVPVHVVSWLDSQQEEFIIKDNVGYGEWDWDILANEWDANQLEDWGLDVWTPEPEPEEGLTHPDEVPSVPEEPKTKPGDLYILGKHRLLCGDSTNPEHVARLMDGQKADMVFTDPPYGVNCVKNSGVMKTKYEQFENDTTAEFFVNLYQSMPEFFENCVIWGGNYFAHGLPASKHWIVWEKNTVNKDGKQIKKDQSDCELAYTTFSSPTVRRFQFVWNIFREGNRKDELKNRVHPNQKPVGLFVEIFEHYEFGSLIADLFLGSGSTLIAAEKTGRTCYGMELDPKYCDVIVKRWEDFTGKKAELVS